MSRHVVIGGGICGLVAAWSLRLKHPDDEIVIIEREARLGGLLAGVSYPEAGLSFDLGTHIFQETGDTAIDAFLRDSIPPEQLVLLPADAGDLAGAAFQGRLQIHTHFPDLRAHPAHDTLLASLRAHLTDHALSTDLPRGSPLIETARRRFGATYADSVLLPLLAAMYQTPADQLATFALLLPGLTRVVATNEAEWTSHAHDPAWRALLAFPQQRLLPSAFRHGRRSFYTRDEGAYGVIKALAQNLAASGVIIFKNTHHLELDFTSLRVTHGGLSRPTAELAADTIFISTGVIGAARLLGISPSSRPLDSPLLHRVVHLRLDRPIESDLHYFYGLDPDCPFYRVTHYGGFSGESADRRLTLEVLERSEISDSALPDHLLHALHGCGFLTREACDFVRVEHLPRGFPRPTVNNLLALSALQEQVLARLPPSIKIGGAGTGEGLFFTNETLLATHAAISGSLV